jgi:CO dehydrogenase/acetyl-CoA synthase delta subunit
MMHPAAVLTLKDVIHRLETKENPPVEQIHDWVSVRI